MHFFGGWKSISQLNLIDKPESAFYCRKIIVNLNQIVMTNLWNDERKKLRLTFVCWLCWINKIVCIFSKLCRYLFLYVKLTQGLLWCGVDMISCEYQIEKCSITSVLLPCPFSLAFVFFVVVWPIFGRFFLADNFQKI